MGQLISFHELSLIRAKHAESVIVHCHGVFDLFHYGHLTYLRDAKKKGDLLVVTVTGDDYVNKGPGRPRFSEQKRAEMLSALSIVDYVAINQSQTAVNIIECIRPNYYVKGPDYSDAAKDISGGILSESDACLRCGCKLVITAGPSESSSELINEYFSTFSSEQREIINQVKSEITSQDILEILDNFKNLKVLVVGEPIIDTYIFCEPRNLSSKSASISANFIREENYPGGALAVARHLRALGCQVSMAAPIGVEYFALESLDLLREEGIEIILNPQAKLVTPKKIRYISEFREQRIFEMTILDDSKICALDDEFEKKIKEKSETVDLIIALDFGHGLWEADFLKNIDQINVPISLNVQSNSSNLGFNLYTKHKKYNYLVIDERELRLGLHDRYSSLDLLMSKNDINKPYSITLGAKGSVYVDKDGKRSNSPTFFVNPIDTTGAGDAYFAITSLMNHMGYSGHLLVFIGNLYAGLKTKIVGNKYPVSQIDLKKTINTLLK